MGLLPPFYTACYLEVRSPALSALWLLCGAAVVGYTLVGSLLGRHGYVEREAPNIDAVFWQDVAVDGAWWPLPGEKVPDYCGIAYKSSVDNRTTWGSDSIGCVRPADLRGTFVYPTSNEIRVALSVAHGDDPVYNTSEVLLYQDMERVTLGLQVSFSTSRGSVPHVPRCEVLGQPTAGHPGGRPVPSRYEALHPGHGYGEGYVLLSVEDIVRAAGRELSDLGVEGAPLRLSGLEVVTMVDVRNYHVPYRWPSASWNPFGLDVASKLECKIHFSVLRDQFTPAQWFYDRTVPVALQYGLRLTVVGTGSVGYFSAVELAEKLLVGFAAFTLAQAILDLAWYYLHPLGCVIAQHAYAPLRLDEEPTTGAHPATAKPPSAHRETSAEKKSS